MSLEEFKDRISTYPNRRKLKIITQTADEIIADVEYADSASQDGTPVNAAKLNEIRTTVDSANTYATNAYNTASSANTTAGNADTKAGQALSNSQSALTTANNAYSKADEALNQVVNMQGTKVKVNGVIVSEFDSNTKVDVSTYNTLSNRVATIETKPLMTKINYDSTTDTFIL